LSKEKLQQEGLTEAWPTVLTSLQCPDYLSRLGQTLRPRTALARSGEEVLILARMVRQAGSLWPYGLFPCSQTSRLKRYLQIVQRKG